jgi:hypothetical protein
MKLEAIHIREGKHPVYRATFDDQESILRFTLNGYGRWVTAPYDDDTSYLGERVTLQELARDRPQAFDAFIGWLAVNTEYGRNENGQIIREEA